tara:strand:+ start:240 stop:440 length:201 start_codon:yes stop_codon:yes gene_type:complete
MFKTKAKLKFKANSFDVLEPGDHVICAVSNKKIPLNNLNYWNIELQEAYYSPKEVKIRFDQIKKSE